MNFLFWNIGNKEEAFAQEIGQLVKNKKYNVDVLILAENTFISDEAIEYETGLKRIKRHDIKEKKFSTRTYAKAEIRISHLEEMEQEETFQIRLKNFTVSNLVKKITRFKLFKIEGDFAPVFMACVHLPSKRNGNQNEKSLVNIAYNFKKAIEEIVKSDRLFVVGDFNMNPFELGMIGHTGFYALNNRKLLENDIRQIDFVIYTRYYNPCWSLLGDFVQFEPKSIRLGASLYFSGDFPNYHWHLIDQVIMRKPIIKNFVQEKLQIIENKKYLNELLANAKERDDNPEYSFLDHLPLYFEFNF